MPKEITTEAPSLKRETMSVISDVRGLLQDMVTPDLKTTIAKLDIVDKKIDTKVDAQSALMEARFKAQDEIAAARHNELVAKLETYNAQIATYNAEHTARYDQIMKALDTDKRLQELEHKLNAPASRSSEGARAASQKSKEKVVA